MNRFENEKQFALFVSDKLKGKAYLVGGAVRDQLLGKPAKDCDYVITGVPLNAIPFTKIAGNTFPVFRLQIGDNSCEVALARKEKKSGVILLDDEIVRGY